MTNRAHSLILLFLLTCGSLTAEPIVSKYNEPYPTTSSKKGLQVEMVDDAIALGIKHAALNLNLSALVDPAGKPGNPSHQVGDATYHFHRGYLARMDQQIRALSSQGILVNLILLTYQSPDPRVNELMLHPQAVAKPPNRLCAFNTVTPEGRNWLNATVEFLAERWSRPDRKFGRIVGYVVGNEVNSHWWWSNMGEVGMKAFADDYLRTVRLVHGAIRRQASWARVYISLEHHWTIRYPAGNDKQAFPGRDFLTYFAAQCRAQGDFDWHLAYHPYPENLRDPQFWLDTSATPHLDTPRITFKNVEVLCRFMRQPAMQFNGKPRRIILSEQGFDTPKSPDGEAIQAAAYCLAYRKVDALPAIDAFILHRHVDHPREGGLLLGLRRWGPDKPKKKIYDCFKAADTPHWRQAFEFALPIVGLKDWP